MKKLLCVSIFVLVFCAALFGQNDSSASCPAISVDGPSRIMNPGETATFTVKIDNSDSLKLIYNWTTSIGEIIEGQGTSTITIKPPSELDWSLTATVEIKGLPRECPNSASETMHVDRSLEAVKIDEFGKATNGNVKMRFESFMNELQNDPSAQGYIINYGSAKELLKRERQIRNAIVFLKYDAQRITIIRGGENEDLIKTQLWIVPAGAAPPTPK